MSSIRLVHWNQAEAEIRAAELKTQGFDVEHDMITPARIREWRTNPPGILVIDLSRLPSQGRDLAVGIRHAKSTRRIPIVFVGGDPEKVSRIKELLPDAFFTDWCGIKEVVRSALSRPLPDPVVPDSVFAGYAGTPLAKKLGIKANSVIVLIDAPENFEKTLGAVPGGVTISREPVDSAMLTLWFCTSQKELKREIEQFIPSAEKGGLWIVWPKKSSGVVSDLTQNIVRQIGLAAGLVDFKVCSVDATWSALRFTRRPNEKR